MHRVCYDFTEMCLLTYGRDMTEFALKAPLNLNQPTINPCARISVDDFITNLLTIVTVKESIRSCVSGRYAT